MTHQPIAQVAINTIRTLAVDAIQQADSGHPGTPMGMAPVVYCLWQHFLRFDPEDPIWPNRDRFVLSAGHASMLLYSMLHLTGVKAVDPDYEIVGKPSVSLDDIKTFRQLGSRCPGHPEYRWTSGVETTTGPLGQGVATSVGMAIANKWLAARYNRPAFELFTADVYALCGDGCMMEGISNEAASLAGHLQLDNLCWIYDNNHVTIEGHTNISFRDDVASRFLSYGWNVQRVGDANDLDMLERAFRGFKKTVDRPTIIIVDSHIGYGSPHKEDSPAAHGEPLGEDEIKLTKRSYGWPEDAKFLVPEGVREHFAEGLGKRSRELRIAWESNFQEYKRQYPMQAEEIERMQRRELPDGWDGELPQFTADPKGLASRDSSSQVLNTIAKRVPWLMGGSADLAPSTKTRLSFDGAGDFQAGNPSGRNLHFGIREHAMAAILNGMSLVKVRPFGSGFFIFSDYARGAIRLSALMELPIIHIFTHDSIGVGEDGPTHQPVEQLANLRALPGLLVFRPCDANEVVEAWRVIMKQHHAPAVLVLTRQALPTLDRAKYATAEGLARGAYILADAPNGRPDVILLATGSEVALCIQAYEQLVREGIKARVVSMPCWRLFEAQDRTYRDCVLPPSVKARVSVEEGSTFGWERYVGENGESLGMHFFGASAPLKTLQNKFGFTLEHVVEAAKAQLGRAHQAARSR
ncbi:MAG TPA: transketolase [Terriglobales bacterium]|nr:transketolase [Terriglobales bacterium]